MSGPTVVFVESNTTGSGRQFCAEARRLGIRPVMLAARPERYPYVALDDIDVRIVDTTRPDDVRAACDEFAELVGVTSSSEYFVALAAEVADERGLPAPDARAVRACRAKDRQRAVMAEHGVAVPGFAVVRTPDEAVRHAHALGWPVVVKPTTGSGSVGVRRCDDAAEVAAWAGELLIADDRDHILVESYLDGPEFSVETFDGDVVGVVAKRLGPEPYFVEIGHDYPASVPTAALAGTARAAVRALGITWGPAHVELRMTSGGPAVVEVNPRLAGGMIPTVIRLAGGTDLVAAVVARTCGLPVPQPFGGDGSSAIRFLVATHDGRLGAVHGIDEARAVPGVADVVVTARPDAPVAVSHNFTDRLGYVLAAGPDAGRRADEALSLLRPDITASSDVAAG